MTAGIQKRRLPIANTIYSQNDPYLVFPSYIYRQIHAVFDHFWLVFVNKNVKSPCKLSVENNC